MEDNLEKSVDVINGETVEGDSGTPETGMTSGVKRTAEGKGKEPAKKSKRDKTSKERDSESDESSDEDSSESDSDQPRSNIGMFATPNEPLTDHVDSKVKKMITKGHYVEMSKLFRKDVAQKTSQVFSFENGSLQLKDTSERKINSFGVWLDCFIVFMTIRGKKYPDEMIGMLKHLETVKRLGLQGFDGIAYDCRFRHMKANYGSLPWGQYIPEIVSTLKPSFGKPNSGTMNKNSGNSQGSASNGNTKVCRFFNSGSCMKRDRCDFKHVCSKCNSFNHGANSCLK